MGSSASSSRTRTQSLIMHDAKIDDLGSSSSSFQPSHSGTLTTSASINTSTTTASSGIGQRIIPSTKVAGILAGIIVIITIIVICFIKGHQRSRRQWMSSQPGMCVVPPCVFLKRDHLIGFFLMPRFVVYIYRAVSRTSVFARNFVGWSSSSSSTTKASFASFTVFKWFERYHGTRCTKFSSTRRQESI